MESVGQHPQVAGLSGVRRALAEFMIRNRRRTMILLLLKFRRLFVIALHMLLIVIANYLAFWLRFDGVIPEAKVQLCAQMLPWLLAIRALTFVPFRLYEGLWRYASIWDLGNIIMGVFTSTSLFYGVVHWGFDREDYPRSIFIIDTVLLIFLLG
ncbi:MAG: hypothetical protein AB1671_14830, partial [Thermodesulfobacteriota bacterium]